MLVALEGLDGSGKRTQTDLLLAAARDAGISCSSLAFPRYGETRTSLLLRSYLNGELGPLSDISPWLIAPLYALDRYESRFVLAELMDGMDLVVIDRFTASNLAYNGSRLPADERFRFLDWMTDLEHEHFHLPRPDLYLYLHVPVEQSRQMVLTKSGRSYTEKPLDILEADLDLLAQVEGCYRTIADRDIHTPWRWIDCLDPNGAVRSEREIAAQVWEEVERLLNPTGPA